MKQLVFIIINNSKGKKLNRETPKNGPVQSPSKKSTTLTPNKVETWEYYEMRNNIIKNDELEKQGDPNNFLDQNSMEDFIQSAESQFIKENNDSVLEGNENKFDDKMLDNVFQYSSVDDASAYAEDFDLSKLNINDAKRKTSAKEMLEGITKRVVLNEVNPNASKYSNNNHLDMNKLNPRFLNEKSHLLAEPFLNFGDGQRNMIFSSMNMNKRNKDIEYNQLLECLSNDINFDFLIS